MKDLLAFELYLGRWREKRFLLISNYLDGLLVGDETIQLPLAFED